MKFQEINPFIRHAKQFCYKSDGESVIVRDCRLFYVVSGKAELYVDKKHFELVRDSLFYCCRGTEYTIASDNVEMIVLNFDLNHDDCTHLTVYPRIRVEQQTTPSGIDGYFVEDSKFINSYLFLTRANPLLESFETILSEFSTRFVYYREQSSAILKSILTKIERYSIDGSINSKNAISDVISWISLNYAKPITNEILSKMSGYHEYHLNRLFIKYTGLTIHQYILTVRINEAKKRLIGTELSLEEIAEEIGFSSNTHFSSAFKRIEGMSPNTYRKIYKKIL